MPTHNYSLTDSFADPSELLEAKGPLIKIEVSPTQSLRNFLIAEGKTPTSIIGWGILDTGASTTCVSKNTLMRIGGNPISTKEVSTPGNHKIELDVYPAKLSFPGTGLAREFEEALAMVDLEIEHEGFPIIAFLGREVLSKCKFTYDGRTGDYKIEY
jgi:hypothetical protein